MNLLAARTYDPAVAVTKVTTALLGMTALDTTNLRLSVTVPQHGMLFIRLIGTLHGAVTYPQIMLGVLNGPSVVGRVSAELAGANLAATSQVKARAEFVVTGLTPGALTLDAAYGVETLVASTGLKYGGPNDSTANNAFGGFQFEIWDPQPVAPAAQLAIDAGGRVSANVTQFGGVAGTFAAGRPEVNLSAGAVDLVWDEATAAHQTAGTAGKALIDGAAGGDPWSISIPGSYPAGTAGKILGDNLNVAVSSRASSAEIPSVAQVVNGVWDANLSLHNAPGTAGLQLSTIVQVGGNLLDLSQVIPATGCVPGTLGDFLNPNRQGGYGRCGLWGTPE